MNKFEKLIEYIINDEDSKARELFHSIVVEKSRDIYESIMAQEGDYEEGVQGAGSVEHMHRELDNEESMAEDDEEFELGGEMPADDGEEGDAEEMPADGEFGGEPEHEESQDDKIMNIDAKLDELLAKFDEIMGDEGHGEEMPAPEEGGDQFGGEEMPAPEEGGEEQMFEAEDEEDKDSEEDKEDDKKDDKKGNPFAKKADESRAPRIKSTAELMREYTEKIADINLSPSTYSEGEPVGATGKKVSVNTKYTGKQEGPNFGGKAVTSKGGNQDQDGTSPTKASNEYTKGEGQVPLAKKNVNVPGGTAGKTAFKSKEGSYETGGDRQSNPTGKMAGTGAKSEQQGEKNVKSPLAQNSGKKI